MSNYLNYIASYSKQLNPYYQKISRKKLVSLLMIIFVAIFLRFNNIYNLTTFSGEEGYDLLIVKRIIVDKKFTLLGPKSGPYNNISEVHLGPFYYYWILPSLFVSKLNPIGPSIFSALISTLSLIVIFIGLKRYFNYYIAITASSIYAVSTVIVNQSRSSSPAYYVPFFSFIVLFLILELSKNNKTRYYFLTGTILGILVQLHYSIVPLFLILAGAPFILKFKASVKKILVFISGTAITSLGMIIFELKHEFFISKSIISQLTGSALNTKQFWETTLLNSYEKSTQLFFSFPFKPLLFIGPIIFLVLPLLIWREKSSNTQNKYYKFLYFWILVNIICISFFPGEIQNHYFNFSILPILVLLSLLIYKLQGFFSIGKIIFILIIFSNVFLIDISSDHGYTMPKGLNLRVIKKASDIIYNDKVKDNKSFNVASTLDGDTRARPYRYFLEVKGLKPNDVEHYPDSQLIYLISRDNKENIKMHTVWEIASFAPFDILNLGEIQNGIFLYKLKKT
jgi:hypothetical protein